ncbi:MADS-box transcription factor 14 isoform X1 [Cryptomeria japonica]|uniref:MADS-box transcription factor 14 isoform X1 n=1 Tax=Cryptomeria japonica TaxID=3369 RepID=UPI0027D9E2B1|nr:MADS-box transcription factor 14 isoform X1 [Cryptomeria japonica]
MIHLEKNSKHMIGEDLELLNFKELQCLEKKISLGARKIHSRKEKVSVERIRSLKIKEKSLTVENANLEKKIGASIAIKNLETDAATQQDLPQTNLNLMYFSSS